MPGTDKPVEVLEARKKLLREQMEYASSKISDTVRYTALGQIGVTYAVIVSNTPFATGMMTAHFRLVFCVLIFGCGALVFDFVQYVLTYVRAVHLSMHPEEDASGMQAAAWLSFWLKCAVALIGMVLLGSVIFSATYVATTTASAKLTPAHTVQVIGATPQAPATSVPQR